MNASAKRRQGALSLWCVDARLLLEAGNVLFPVFIKQNGWFQLEASKAKMVDLPLQGHGNL